MEGEEEELIGDFIHTLCFSKSLPSSLTPSPSLSPSPSLPESDPNLGALEEGGRERERYGVGVGDREGKGEEAGGEREEKGKLGREKERGSDRVKKRGEALMIAAESLRVTHNITKLLQVCVCVCVCVCMCGRERLHVFMFKCVRLIIPFLSLFNFSQNIHQHATIHSIPHTHPLLSLSHSQSYNGRVCQLVLGAGARKTSKLKSISAKHLCLSAQVRQSHTRAHTYIYPHTHEHTQTLVHIILSLSHSSEQNCGCFHAHSHTHIQTMKFILSLIPSISNLLRSFLQPFSLSLSLSPSPLSPSSLSSSPPTSDGSDSQVHSKSFSHICSHAHTHQFTTISKERLSQSELF